MSDGTKDPSAPTLDGNQPEGDESDVERADVDQSDVAASAVDQSPTDADASPRPGAGDDAPEASTDGSSEGSDAGPTSREEVVAAEAPSSDAASEDMPTDIVDDGSAGAFDAVARQRDEYLDALRRVQAEFENFRKQALRRQGDAIEHATGRLVEDLLAVLDACDAGIEHGDEGVIAVFTALLGVLEKAGLERLDPAGEPFDPNVHEAVMHEPADGDDATADGPVVADVLRPGYRWKERTLRAAMVKVRG